MRFRLYHWGGAIDTDRPEGAIFDPVISDWTIDLTPLELLELAKKRTTIRVDYRDDLGWILYITKDKTKQWGQR